MKQRLTALVLAAALALGCGCAAQQAAPTPDIQPETPAVSQPAEQAIPFTLAYDASDSLDPLNSVSVTNLALTWLVFEGLFRTDQTFTPSPQLCTSWSVSEDALSWRFVLRRDAVFSNGEPLTAQHVKSSLDRARAGELYAERLKGISSVSAEDGAVTIHLYSPNGALPALLEVPIVLLDETGAALGTGLYCYDLTGEACVLRENPHRRGEEALPVDTIPLYSVASADQRIAAFDTGLITATSSDLTGTNALGYSGSYETWDCPTSTMLYLGFNCASGPCKEKLLRQAISRAVDRSVVVTSLLSGHADAAVLPVSPQCDLYDENLASELTYSVSAANQLLADGGYVLNEGELSRWGRKIELELLVNIDNTFRLSVAEYLAQELGKLGVKVTVKKLPWEEFLVALDKGDFDLYLAQVKLTPDFDLSALLTGALNYADYWSESTNARLYAFRAATGGARAAAASELYANLASTLPFTPLCFMRTSVLTQWGSVSGLKPTQQDPFYQFESWEIE